MAFPIVPLLSIGGSLLGSWLGGRGRNKPQAPDPNAWFTGGLGNFDVSGMMNTGRQAISQMTNDAMQNMFRQIGQRSASRGLDNTSFYQQQAQQFAPQIMQSASSALADLYSNAMQMKQRGQLAGAQNYANLYSQYLGGLNQQNQGGNWLTNAIGLMSQMPWL